MFENFPKTRPPLSKELEEIYQLVLRNEREGTSAASAASQRIGAWLHTQVARDVTGGRDPVKATLQLGAGHLDQLPYEPAVQVYDIVEPDESLYKDSPHFKRIRTAYSDIAEIPAGSRYDRITSVATLEHYCDLPQVIARTGLLLAEGGAFRATVPSEGTWLWTLGWKMTTGLEFNRKHGLDYGEIIRYEHVNTAKEIEEVLKYFFEKTSCRVFGLAKSVSLYRYYECRKPRIDRCVEILRTKSPG